VQPTPVVTVTPVSATTDEVDSLEYTIGVLVASVAALLADGLCERQQGALTTRTKKAGGDAVFELFRLRQFMIADWPFDDIAREYGRAVLRETCGSGIDARTVDVLVDEVLDILRKVVRAAAN
jgi:hypothetical protein